MAGLVLTKTRFRGGVWEGLLTGAGAAPPRLVLRHRDETLPGPDVTPGQDAFLVQARVPADRIADGLQTFVIATADDAAVLASFAIYAGEDVAEDLRAQVDLLRAELDLLKQAFRRHVTGSD